MAEIGSSWWSLRFAAMLATWFLVVASLYAVAEEKLEQVSSKNERQNVEYYYYYFVQVMDSLWAKGQLGYEHAWPDMKFDWRLIAGTIIGFFGAAFGSVGGVGGGGIFVPMLTLIIGFDAKSSTAISKCMIMGAAASSVYYNIRRKHPTLDLPIIDYDLALLFQPMLVLGISIGVIFNVIFSDWMITVLLIILFLFTSTKAFLKGVETWKRETIMKKEAARRLASYGSSSEGAEYIPLTRWPGDSMREIKDFRASTVFVVDNVRWKEFGILVAVWIIVLVLQIAQNYTRTCSGEYWILNLLQIPVAVGVSAYEAVGLYKGRRVIASKGDASTEWQVHQLLFYCACGLVAGIVGGLLGLGGGFILGPLFLELGIPPQVSSATATFSMAFSSSMSVVEYYLLRRFPLPYALYFIAVATTAALVGQHVVRKIITLLGRASLIIFILSFTIFVSAISLGGIGIADMIMKIEQNEYMGFENICSSRA